MNVVSNSLVVGRVLGHVFSSLSLAVRNLGKSLCANGIQLILGAYKRSNVLLCTKTFFRTNNDKIHDR